MKQRFREDTAGTIRCTPTEGPPITSATIELYKPDGTELQASTAATIPTVSTAINLAAGYAIGTRTIIVDSTTGISAGDNLWFGTVGTDTIELVRVLTVDSATQIELTEGLQFAHDDNEEVRGSEITYALTGTHTAERDENYRAEWTYTVGSTTYRATQLFDVVKRVFGLAIGPATLRTYLPSALLRQAPAAGELRRFIVESEASIMRALRRRKLKPDRVRDTDQFKYLGILGVKEMLLDRQAAVDVDALPMLEDARTQWNLEFDRIIASGLSWYDIDENLSVSTGTSTETGIEETGESEEGLQRALYAVLG